MAFKASKASADDEQSPTSRGPERIVSYPHLALSRNFAEKSWFPTPKRILGTALNPIDGVKSLGETLANTHKISSHIAGAAGEGHLGDSFTDSRAPNGLDRQQKSCMGS